MSKTSAVTNVVPIRPDDDRPPETPAAHILHFKPRTEVIGVRVPADIAILIQREAEIRYMSKSHLVLRIITAWAEAEGNEPCLLRAQGRRLAS